MLLSSDFFLIFPSGFYFFFLWGQKIVQLIGHGNGVVLKDSSGGGGSGCGGGGATWAFEVGGQARVCPIIVEDLSPPGQMLIEVLPLIWNLTEVNAF